MLIALFVRSSTVLLFIVAMIAADFYPSDKAIEVDPDWLSPSVIARRGICGC